MHNVLCYIYYLIIEFLSSSFLGTENITRGEHTSSLIKVGRKLQALTPTIEETQEISLAVLFQEPTYANS